MAVVSSINRRSHRAGSSPSAMAGFHVHKFSLSHTLLMVNYSGSILES
jgi:hypothetical protein